MIIASNEIVKRIVTALNAIGVGVYSVVPPVNVLRYIHVEDSTETATNEKLRKITEGFITIKVIEKFRGDDGTLLWVTDTSISIVTAIQPLTTSTFGISGGIDIFAMNFESQTGGFIQTESGRFAIRSLRLKYNAQIN